MNIEQLFTPVQIGDLHLKNRIFMAPMTRNRAMEDDTPSQLQEEYYTQRATAGLIISEGTHPSANGKGYCRTPGIYNAKHYRSWAKIVDAVHARGGAIALQIMHCGRIGHALNKAPETEIVAPSSIAAQGEIYTEEGMRPFPKPRALRTEEIANVVQEYHRASRQAITAGFDAVELHCTSGYLPAQFLSSGTNLRDDRYGASVAGRCRFVLEVLEAMCDAAGPGRVGMRICPGNPFNDLHDENPEQSFAHLLQSLKHLGLAWLHVIRMPATGIDNPAFVRKYFEGPLILNDSYDAREAEQTVSAGEAAAISFARNYIANPDLVERLQNDWPLARMQVSTLYTPGAAGYTDYQNFRAGD